MAIAYGTPMEDGTIYTGGATNARPSGAGGPQGSGSEYNPNNPYTWTDEDAQAVGFASAADAQKGIVRTGMDKGNESLFNPNAAKLGTEGRDMFAGLISDVQGRGAQAFDAQMGVLGGIEDIASGRAPSVAEMQMRSGLDMNQGMMAGMLASQRGGNVGAVAGNIAQSGAQNAQMIARETSMMRAQEVKAAYELLNASYAQMQAFQFQQAAFYETLGYTIDEASRQAAMDIAKARADAANKVGTAGNSASGQFGGQAVAGIAQSVGTMLQGMAAGGMMSDARTKKNIVSGDAEVRALLDELEAFSFEYKEPERVGRGHGRRVGVMAQDLAKSKEGRNLLVELDGLLGVDIGKTATASLAAAAHLNKRLRSVEALLEGLV